MYDFWNLAVYLKRTQNCMLQVLWRKMSHFMGSEYIYAIFVKMLMEISELPFSMIFATPLYA